ncbi:hypothetical protein D3C71_1600100 [compost metagenome]
MSIPSPVKELNVPYSFFYQLAGQQDIISERGFPRLSAIHIMNILWFIVDIHHFRSRNLHPVGHFILRDPGKNFRIIIVCIFQLIRSIDSVN